MVFNIRIDSFVTEFSEIDEDKFTIYTKLIENTTDCFFVASCNFYIVQENTEFPLNEISINMISIA